MSQNKRKPAVLVDDSTSAEVVLQPDAVSDNSMVSEHSMVMKFESASDSPPSQGKRHRATAKRAVAVPLTDCEITQKQPTTPLVQIKTTTLGGVSQKGVFAMADVEARQILWAEDYGAVFTDGDATDTRNLAWFAGLMGQTSQNKVDLNRFEIFKGHVSAGKVVYRNTSRVNHHCNPNAVYFIDSTYRMFVMSICDISRGQEIFIRYSETAGHTDHYQSDPTQPSEDVFSCNCNLNWEQRGRCQELVDKETQHLKQHNDKKRYLVWK